MKKAIFFLICMAAFAAVGCNDEIENDLNLLERRLKEVQAACDKLNGSITELKSVVSAWEDNDFVTGNVRTETIDGRVVYTITFKNSGQVRIQSGRDAGTPVIGVDTLDGRYYWTITYPGKEPEFIINATDGTPIAASTGSIRFRIEEGQWQVSYDEGLTWVSQYNGEAFGRATGESPQSFFDSVIDSGDFIIFRMADSSTIEIPSWSAYEKIQETVRTANENYKATQSIIKVLKEKLFINGVLPIITAAGDTSGYRMTLSDGTEMTFYNGFPTTRPEIGVSRDPDNPSDTAYYWTVRQAGDTAFVWALCDGLKVRADADAVAPQIAVKKNYGIYHWEVSYDGGETWSPVRDTSGNNVRACLSQNAVMDSISVTDEYVYIRQASEEYRIERYQDFEVQLSSTSLTMAAGDTAKFTVSLKEGTDYSEYEVLPVATGGFVAKVTAGPSGDKAEWEISVIAPSGFNADSRLSLIVSDGRGLLKTYAIALICKK